MMSGADQAAPQTTRNRAPGRPDRRPPGRRPTAADLVYEALYEAIGTMELVPGTPLQEKTLTQRFGVSRTPVREALIRLAEDGLVDVFPQSGTFVSRVPVEVLPEAAQIRQALEDMAVRRTAEIASPADLARLDVLLMQQQLMAELGDTGAFHEADEAFHEAVAQIAGYASLGRLLRQVKLQINRARRLTLPVEGRMAHVIAEHRRIRDAIAAHDIEAAREAMRVHLSVVIPDIAWLRREYPDYFI
jgi:DNA-binding GntR family transcriptional regulator